MKNFVKNNEVINNVFVKDIKKDLQQFEVFSNKKNEIQFDITKKFIDKKSRIYTLSPNRDLGSKTFNESYNNLLFYY